MRWRGREESSNVEDRRGIGGAGLAVGGGLGSVVILVIALLFGVDPSQLLNSGQEGGPGPATQTGQQPTNPQEDEMVKFVRVVVRDTEKVWGDIFQKSGRQYREPRLEIFSQQTQSACGVAGASVGPFYCPADQKIYIDLSFYDEMKRRFRAPGDFAQAYVIAHEVGHHVQNLLGTSGKVDALQRRAGEAQANRLSVMLELQADCYAGVWGFYEQQHGIIEPGDIEEALNAASAIGDDRLQKEAQGYVVPDSFTHGSSEQRARWFRQGFESGDTRRCDTFNARGL
ncbi:MAG TPA: neutral zinc metallopeptidase [Pyrinomonadaceae bacterium]|nr:neutral zinc metallopeptidase [Pyrinomonadaceae bacterium]